MATAAPVSSLVADLAALDAAALPAAGGKAANLGELVRAGFPVPGGFVVTTEAYARVAAGLAEPPAGTAARAALRAAPVPPGVADAVRRAYAGLGDDVPVAVRSSATAEDLPGASFAGQQDTFLNVVGADAVLDAVRRCWASLWTDRAVSYREAAGIGHAGVRLAVVVQRMVDARVAGVLFTADPVTGRRTRSVIDASPGLGEAVVSGAVDPDHYVADDDGRVVERRLGAKQAAVRALPGGGTEHVTLEGHAGEACLTEAQVRALVALGRRVEAHFGSPQDIEWALDGAGALWLTQSRPVTTLHPVPPTTLPGPRAFLCVSLAQGLTRPVTPMGLAAFRVIASTAATRAFGAPVADPLAGPPQFSAAGGRAFVDVTGALHSRVGRAIVTRVFGFMEARTALVVRALGDDPAFAVRTRSPLPFARRAARVLVRFRVPVLVATAVVRPAAARARVARIGAELRALAVSPADPTSAQRLDHVQRVLAAVFPIMPRVGPVFVTGFAMLGLARALAGPDMDEPTTHEVLRGLPHNSTTAMDLELWALAVRVRADGPAAAALRESDAAGLGARFRRGELPPALQDGLAAFLTRHGHRAVAEIDVGVPRWSDDPAHVLGVLANYLRLDDPALAPDAQFARGARAAEAACAEVVARVRRRSRLRGAAVAFALRRVRELVGMREEHKDLLVRLLSHVRAQLAVVGADLAGRGLLDAADDVFFLDLHEARTALGGADHRALVAGRRAEYERELRRRHVPRVLLSDGTEPEALAPPAADPDALAGTAASAGVVTAPARVVLDPVGAHLEPGEVLVAPSTDPGWTPLFLTAGGLVMEMGGSNSHGAVVAREYGIPAVVGVPGATSRLRTGDVVTVDGAAGTVRAGA